MYILWRLIYVYAIYYKNPQEVPFFVVTIPPRLVITNLWKARKNTKRLTKWPPCLGWGHHASAVLEIHGRSLRHPWRAKLIRPTAVREKTNPLTKLHSIPRCSWKITPNLILLMVQKSGDHHLGCTKTFCKSWGELPTSTGDRRISFFHQQ